MQAYECAGCQDRGAQKLEDPDANVRQADGRLLTVAEVAVELAVSSVMPVELIARPWAPSPPRPHGEAQRGGDQGEAEPARGRPGRRRRRVGTWLDDDGHEIAPAKLAGWLVIDLGHDFSIVARLVTRPSVLQVHEALRATAPSRRASAWRRAARHLSSRSAFAFESDPEVGDVSPVGHDVREERLVSQQRSGVYLDTHKCSSHVSRWFNHSTLAPQFARGSRRPLSRFGRPMALPQSSSQQSATDLHGTDVAD